MCFSSDLDTWTLSAVMFDYKYDMACAVNSVPEMIINGGNRDPYGTWTTSDGEAFRILPEMPSGNYGHCAVSLDGDDLFVTGNFDSFLYHSDTIKWERLRDIPTTRSGLACGMVHNSAGEQEIITAGGYGVYDRVEIFNLQSGQWRTGQSNEVSLIFIETVVLIAKIHYRKSFA